MQNTGSNVPEWFAIYTLRLNVLKAVIEGDEDERANENWEEICHEFEILSTIVPDGPARDLAAGIQRNLRCTDFKVERRMWRALCEGLDLLVGKELEKFKIGATKSDTRVTI